MSGACECVFSCEHRAFIIFNVVLESQSKAANEAHRVSPLQEPAPAVYWIPSPTFYSSYCMFSSKRHEEMCRGTPVNGGFRENHVQVCVSPS